MHPPVQATTILRGPLAPKAIGQDGKLSNPGAGQPVDTLVELKPSKYIPFGYRGGNMEILQVLTFSDTSAATGRINTPMANNGVFYDGDPTDIMDWSEISDGNTPGDRRMIASMGPFDLQPGAINEIIVAYSAYQDSTLSHLENVSAIYRNTEKLHELFDNCFQDPCSFTVGTEPSSITNIDLKVVPNPNDGSFNLEYNSGDVFEIVDVSGKLIEFGPLPEAFRNENNKTNFILKGLENGVYFMKVKGDKELGIVKFVVKQ